MSKCQNNVKSVLARVFRKHKKKIKKKTLPWIGKESCQISLSLDMLCYVSSDLYNAITSTSSRTVIVSQVTKIRWERERLILKFSDAVPQFPNQNT